MALRGGRTEPYRAMTVRPTSRRARSPVIAAPLWCRRGARLPTPTPVTGPAHRPDPPYSSTTAPGTTSGADTWPSVSTTVNAKS